MFTKLFVNIKKDETKVSQEKKEEALQNINIQISEMETLIEKLNILQKILRENAKNKLIERDKSYAKQFLYKRKKVMEKLKEIQRAKTFIEEKKDMIESTGITKEILNIIKHNDKKIQEAKEELDKENLEEQIEQLEDKKECEKEIFDFFIEYKYENIDDVEEEIAKLKEELRIERKLSNNDNNKDSIEEDNIFNVNSEELNLDNLIKGK